MDKYLYVAMTGASQNALAQKAHANNLANVSTNGFQRDLEQARSMPVFGDSFPARLCLDRTPRHRLFPWRDD